MKERLDLGKLVTFVPNKKIPVYNWFYYKEGFSRDFAFLVLDMLKTKGPVLDAFAGVGTTLLACKERGIPSIGIDASPLAVFVSRAKTQWYDLDELRHWRDWLFSQSFERPKVEVSGLARRAFKREVLEDIIFFRDLIKTMPDKPRDFFLLALMNAANACSYAYKDGAVIKFKKRPVPSLRKMLKRVIKRMLSDLKRIEFKPVRTEVILGDARDMPLGDESVDAIITSPPYLNKIEYARVYSIEMELFFGESNWKGLKSGIGMEVRVSPEDILGLEGYLGTSAPDVAYKYFKDMKRVLSEFYRVLAPGGKAVIVIGNGCFPDMVVESDRILWEMGERLGFDGLEFWVVNKRWCMRERVVKVGPLRESVLIMGKPRE